METRVTATPPPVCDVTSYTPQAHLVASHITLNVIQSTPPKSTPARQSTTSLQSTLSQDIAPSTQTASPLQSSHCLQSAHSFTMSTPPPQDSRKKSSPWTIIGAIRRSSSDAKLSSRGMDRCESPCGSVGSDTDSYLGSSPRSSPVYGGYFSRFLGSTFRDTLSGRDMNVLTPTSL